MTNNRYQIRIYQVQIIDTANADLALEVSEMVNLYHHFRFSHWNSSYIPGCHSRQMKERTISHPETSCRYPNVISVTNTTTKRQNSFLSVERNGKSSGCCVWFRNLYSQGLFHVFLSVLNAKHSKDRRDWMGSNHHYPIETSATIRSVHNIPQFGSYRSEVKR